MQFSFKIKSSPIGKDCRFLVKKSSCPGWLSLAAHFYPYFGIEYILDKKNVRGLNCKYDIKEYKKMVHTLLSQMEGVNVDNQGAYKDMLNMVFEHAPNLDAVWELFKNVDLGWLFTIENERVNFLSNSTKTRCEVLTLKTKVPARS